MVRESGGLYYDALVERKIHYYDGPKGQSTECEASNHGYGALFPRVFFEQVVQGHKFTGKERDSESGLDNFGARYDASTMGRFMTPDPLGGKLIDPQTLNKYAYTRNNPTTLIDPTGMYTCADQADCQSKQDIAFEKARQQDLKSKDSDVVRAANAYGDPTKDNGVGVKFGDPGKGRDAITTNGVGQDPNSPNGLRAEETVTVRSGLSGSALDAAVGHEGSHVADAQDFVNAITTAGGMDQSKNLSTYATELKAYMVTQSVLSSENEKRGVGDCGVDPCILGAGVMPAQAKDTINRLLANPANHYGAAPNYGVTPANPGPVLYPSLTTPK
jgi:RHS repeat-associated protein